MPLSRGPSTARKILIHRSAGGRRLGIINHFVLDSPDHVLSVPHHEWQHGFVLSAALVAVLAAFALWSWRRA